MTPDEKFEVVDPRRFTPVGVSPDYLASLTEEELAEVQSQFTLLESASKWIRGDLSNRRRKIKRDRLHGPGAVQLELGLAIEEEVCGAFDFDSRFPQLGFEHHAEVMSLPSLGEQEMWLQRAVDREWTVTELRREIRSAQADPRLRHNKGSDAVEYANLSLEVRKAMAPDLDSLTADRVEVLKKIFRPVVDWFHELESLPTPD
ncbi:MAG: hypothetical protein AAF236_06635 [Verrucomicrobiota bacterium]